MYSERGKYVIGERAKRARHSQVCSIENCIYIIGERAKRARHSQVCSIENRGYIYIGECGSTLYVGLSRIVRNLIQKSTV